MYYKSQQLVYKVFNHVVFALVSNRLGPKFLPPSIPGSHYKKIFNSSYLSRSTTVKLFTTSSATVVNEYKTVLTESKKLCIDIPCDLKVKPIDSQSKDLRSIIVRVIRPEICNFCVEFIESEDILTIYGRLNSFTSSKEINAVSLEIEIPLNHDVKVISEQGNVSISNLRSDNMSVQVTNGSINCKNLYCTSMLFDCFNGNINCEGTLRGNTDIKIKHGDANGFNFQGGHLRVETEKGDINISSTYCDTSTFFTTEGNLFLKNLHRRNFIFVQKGSLVISGLDGSLDAKLNEGNIKVQVTQLNGDSYLETKKGNVILSVAKEDLCLLNLSGKNITIKDNLESFGEMNHSSNCKVFRSFPNSSLTQPTMKVVCDDGEVHLEKKSWVSSLISNAKK